MNFKNNSFLCWCLLVFYIFITDIKKRGILDFWKKWCCVHVAIGTDVVYFEAVWRWSLLSVIYCFWSRGKESDNKLVFRATQRSNQCQITLYKYIMCVLWINCAWVVFWRFMKWGLWNFKECNDSVCVFVLVRTMYYIKNVLMQWCKGGRNDLVESDKYMIWLYFL